MAEGFTTEVFVKTFIDDAAVAALPFTELRKFRIIAGNIFKAEAQRLSKERLSKVSGSRYRDWHRPGPLNQPGRTGEYDKNFRYGLGGNTANLIFTNISPYAVYVERGSNKTNYRIIPRSSNRLFGYSSARSTYFSSYGVTHPGPWRSKTVNKNGRPANPAFGELPGYGAFILSDAMRHAVTVALQQSAISVNVNSLIYS